MSDTIEHHAPSTLKPWANNARTHSKKQLRQIADSIELFGFTNPVLIDKDNVILAGHGRVEAGGYPDHRQAREVLWETGELEGLVGGVPRLLLGC